MQVLKASCVKNARRLEGDLPLLLVVVGCCCCCCCCCCCGCCCCGCCCGCFCFCCCCCIWTKWWIGDPNISGKTDQWPEQRWELRNVFFHFFWPSRELRQCQRVVSGAWGTHKAREHPGFACQCWSWEAAVARSFTLLLADDFPHGLPGLPGLPPWRQAASPDVLFQHRRGAHFVTVQTSVPKFLGQWTGMFMNVLDLSILVDSKNDDGDFLWLVGLNPFHQH